MASQSAKTFTSESIAYCNCILYVPMKQNSVVVATKFGGYSYH